VHFWQVGFVDARAMAELESPPEGVIVHRVPPVSQREAIAYMLGGDVLFVEEFGSIMPSKTLQYLRAGRPILAFLDGGGVMGDVLRGVPNAHVVRREEAQSSGPLIAGLAAGPRSRTNEPSSAITAYSRREIARRFAGLLDTACELRRADRSRRRRSARASVHLGRRRRTRDAAAGS
jgi:hypothetical protein